MATYATENIGTGGLDATYRTAALTDKVTPGEGTFLHVKNGGAGALVVTLVTPGTVDSLLVDDRDVSIPAGEDRFIAVPGDLYANRADSGLATINFDVITSVTFAVLRA